MTNSISSFTQVQSIESLYECLKTPLADDEWGVLALDLDHTLLKASTIFGDEHFFHFLQEQNRKRGIHPDAHYSWTVKIRSSVTYETCEPADKVNQVIASFRRDGWSVKILTARGLDMRSISEAHVKQSGLDFHWMISS